MLSSFNLNLCVCVCVRDAGCQWSYLEPMDTIFVKSVKENGPAHQAGLCSGRAHKHCNDVQQTQDTVAHVSPLGSDICGVKPVGYSSQYTATQTHSKMFYNYVGPQPETYLAHIIGSFIVLRLHFFSAHSFLLVCVPVM